MLLRRACDESHIIWLLCLVCLIAVTQAKTTNIKPISTVGQRVPLHHLSESQYERIVRLMSGTPAVSQARLITAINPFDQRRTLNSSDFNSNFLNLLRVIRFETTDSNSKGQQPDGSSTPLCVIKVSDNAVEERSNSDDESSGVKCVVVVKSNKDADEKKRRLALYSGAGTNAWNSDSTWSFGDATYKPVYQPYYVPYPSYYGQKHSYGFGHRNVPSKPKRRRRPYKVDHHVRKALQEYYDQNRPDDVSEDETEQTLSPKTATAGQFGSRDPYGIYGSLYNPSMFYNPYQSVPGAPPLPFGAANNARNNEFPVNPNYQFRPSYLLNSNHNFDIESRSNKNIAAADEDEDDEETDDDDDEKKQDDEQEDDEENDY